MMRPKISVIIPAYNAEKFLARCINSILNQSFQEFEVIVVNDGSIDNTLKIIKTYQTNDPRLFVIDKINEGVAKARNNALDIAHGEWILFCDADDYFLPKAFEILYNDAISHPEVDLVLGNAYKIDSKGNKSLKFPQFNSKRLIEKYETKPEAQIWSYLFRLSIVKENNITFDPEISYAEDKLFLWMFITYSRLLFEEPEPIYCYEYNINSATNSILKNVKKTNDVFRVAKELDCLMKTIKNDIDKNLLKEQRNISIFQGIRVYMRSKMNCYKEVHSLYKIFFDSTSIFLKYYTMAYIQRAIIKIKKLW